MKIFEELDFQQTAFGEISLRRRSEPKLDNKIIFEVKLNDEFLMSSLFIEAEQQLSTLSLDALKKNGFDEKLNIIVGGLGLGYTALTALQHKSVASLRVIEALKAVISWHKQGILPIGDVLATNPRCKLIHDDFFALATTNTTGFIDNTPVHGVFLDIDHSPKHWLNQENSHFYTRKSLEKLSRKILVGGVFGLWSNEPPDPLFVELLNTTFSQVQTHVVGFKNPYSGHDAKNTIYVSTVA